MRCARTGGGRAVAGCGNFVRDADLVSHRATEITTARLDIPSIIEARTTLKRGGWLGSFAGQGKAPRQYRVVPRNNTGPALTLTASILCPQQYHWGENAANRPRKTWRQIQTRAKKRRAGRLGSYPSGIWVVPRNHAGLAITLTASILCPQRYLWRKGTRVAIWTAQAARMTWLRGGCGSEAPGQWRRRAWLARSSGGPCWRRPRGSRWG